MHSVPLAPSLKRTLCTIALTTLTLATFISHATFQKNAEIFVDNLGEDMKKSLLPMIKHPQPHQTVRDNLVSAIMACHPETIDAIRKKNCAQLEQLSQNTLVRSTLYFMTDGPGCSPLYLAVQTGDIKVVEAVLEMGAYVHQPNLMKNRATALCLARHMERKDISDYLHEYIKTNQNSIEEKKHINEQLIELAITTAIQQRGKSGKKAKGVKRSIHTVTREKHSSPTPAKKLHTSLELETDQDREIAAALLLCAMRADNERRFCSHATAFLRKEMEIERRSSVLSRVDLLSLAPFSSEPAGPCACDQ